MQSRLLFSVFVVFILFLMVGGNHHHSIPVKEGEQADRRTMFEKHYLNDDGSYTAVVSSDPVHFFNNEKGWLEINTSIKENTSGEHAEFSYFNADNIFRSYYPDDISQGFFTILEDSIRISEMLNPRMYYLSENKQQNITEINNSPAFVKAGQIIYSSCYGEHIDLRILQGAGRRKLDYIIKNKKALSDAPYPPH